MPGTRGGKTTGSEDAVHMSFDWFEYARVGGSRLLWTEDWMPDSASWRWSYYSARLRNAVALSKDETMEFSGYIVPRSSGAREGGLLQRILAMIGGGAKGLRYFIFGPEYTFPINCYTENGNFSRLVTEMALGHSMVAQAEEVLFRARHRPAEIAILMPRSSEIWDLFNYSLSNTSGYMYECCVTSSMLAYAADYNAEVFGLFTALAVDENLPVDIIDEDALLENEVLAQYRAIWLTQPNIPSAGLANVRQWAAAGGTLVTVSNAATADEYNMPSPQLGLPRSSRDRWYALRCVCIH